MTAGIAEVGMRTYFSTYHLWAAEYFGSLAAGMEKDHSGVLKFDIQHRAYVTNSTLWSAAFLEAGINEVFDDVSDAHRGYVDQLLNHSKKIWGMWEMGPERC